MTRETKLLIDMWDILHRECHKVVTEENYDAIKKSIKALEQEPCEDCISRQAVLDDLEKNHMTSGVHNQGTWNECVDSMIHTVRSMPSVNPQEPVLDKIRAEIMSKDGLEEALEIIDRYTKDGE